MARAAPSIDAYGEGGFRLDGADCHTSLQCLRPENAERIPNDIIEIEFLKFDFASLLQQSTQVVDDFCRTLIVAAYVGENFLDALEVGRLGLEVELCGLGIAQDGPQRLVKLMRDGGRQRARGSGTVQMNDFYQPLAQFDLGDPTAVALEKQRRDHRGLSQHDGKNRNDQPTVLVPGLVKR